VVQAHAVEVPVLALEVAKTAAQEAVLGLCFFRQH
jgi:hypothetical protein